MSVALRLVNGVYWLALTAWTAALVTAGIAAMNTFTRLPKMNIELRDYASLPTSEHGRLAAGMVMEGVFATVDRIQVVAAVLAVISLILQLAMTRPSWKSMHNLVRCACIMIAAG